MDNNSNNFESLRKDLGLTNRDFAAKMNIPETVYTRIKSGKYNVGSEYKRRIEKAFPNINIKWLLFNEGEKFKPENEITADDIIGIHANAKHIGYFDENIPYVDIHGNNIFYEISPGRYLMKTKLITERARAGYLSGYADPEYIEELPSHTITVNEVHKGMYRSFEVVGDSMDDDSKRSIGDGYIVTGRYIPKDRWMSKLHIHTWNYFIFVTKEDGVLIKEVIGHDVENGVVTLHSLNPDKKTYPDFDLHLSQVNEIYNVVDASIKY